MSMIDFCYIVAIFEIVSVLEIFIGKQTHPQGILCCMYPQLMTHDRTGGKGKKTRRAGKARRDSFRYTTLPRGNLVG
jgi:hypothetical protein